MIPPSMRDVELSEADVDAILDAAANSPSKLVERLKEHPYEAMRRPPDGRRNFRRNLVIYIAHQQGVSARLLADVFAIPVSRVEAIVKRWRENYGVDPNVEMMEGARP